MNAKTKVVLVNANKSGGKKEDSYRTAIERNRRCGMFYAKYLVIRMFNVLTLSKGCAHDERLRARRVPPVCELSHDGSLIKCKPS